MSKLASKKLALAAAVVGVLIFSVQYFGASTEPGAISNETLANWQVELRPFEVELTEQVVFNADSVAAIASSLPSNLARVVYLAPEGSVVDQGEQIVRFDPNPFHQDLRQASEEMEEVASQLERAHAELQIKSSEVEASIEAARQRLTVAELSHDRLVQVEIPSARQTANDEVLAAELEHADAVRMHKMTQDLYADGYASGDELNETRDALARAVQALDASKSRAASLDEVEFVSLLRASELELEQLRREVSRLESSSPNQIQISSGSVARFESRLRQLENTAAKAHHYVEKSAIVAPVAGIVRYPEISFGEDTRKVQIGDTVWQHQTFLVLPDLDSLVAVAAVREVDVGNIVAGQKVRLIPSAFPDRPVTGEVLSVGTVVDDNNQSGGLFEVRISAVNADDRLRPGMTGRASIVTHSYENVWVIPLEAVHYLDGIPVAYVRDGSSWVETPVRLGGSDGVMIAVEHGLKEGQTVALSSPDIATK